jgi:hypothetical protein
MCNAIAQQSSCDDGDICRIPIRLKLHLGIIDRVAAMVADQLIPKQPEGGTFDPREMRLVNPGRGVFGVSLKVYEKECPDRPSRMDVRKWLYQTLPVLQTDDHFLGWWHCTKRQVYYLDVSLLVWGRPRAMAVARTEGQLAIYDYGLGQEEWATPDTAVAC